MSYLIFSIFLVINTGILNLSWAADSTAITRENYRISCGIPLVVDLPDVSMRNFNDVSGSWRLIRTFAGTNDLAAQADFPANLWKSAEFNGTTCYFLHRYEPLGGASLNGILCFLADNKICSFDLITNNQLNKNWNQLAIPGDSGFTTPTPIAGTTEEVTNQCSACHTHGFAAPRKKSYDVAESHKWIDRWKKFAVDGKGPTWLAPPGKEMPPSGIGKCDIPETGNCRSCHGTEWVKPKEANRYCTAVFNPAFDEKGSMTAIGPDGEKEWELLPINDCKTFLNCLGGSCKDTKDSLCGVKLQVSKEGSGTGSVTSVPDGINCGSDCDHLFKKGRSVTLTAVADSNSIFIRWKKPTNEVCQGTNSTCIITSLAMSADYDDESTYLKKAIAVFDRRPPTTTTITIPPPTTTTRPPTTTTRPPTTTTTMRPFPS